MGNTDGFLFSPDLILKMQLLGYFYTLKRLGLLVGHVRHKGCYLYLTYLEFTLRCLFLHGRSADLSNWYSSCFEE